MRRPWIVVVGILVALAACGLVHVLGKNDHHYGRRSILYLLLTPSDLKTIPMSGLVGEPEYQSIMSGGKGGLPPTKRLDYVTSLDSDRVMRELESHFLRRGYSYDGTTLSKGHKTVWIAIIGKKVHVGISDG